MTKSVFVTIAGCANVGKSSLLNALLGQKIAIVTNKPQTTRTRITGILTKDETQYVFIDTPGMHRPKTVLGKQMVKAVSEGLSGTDVCLMVIEADKPLNEIELGLIEKLKNNNIPAILVINKIDTVKEREKLLLQISTISGLYNFEDVLLISALHNTNVDEVQTAIDKFTKESPHYFDDNTLTDQTEKALTAEMIREKALQLLHEEIPHGIAVVIELFEERLGLNDKEILDIEAYIYCERDSHKGIVIGKNGAMLKNIGSRARFDLEEFFQIKVNLKLWVKVRENWRKQIDEINNFGLSIK